MSRQDLTVVGAGIVGLAIARRFLECHQGGEVTVVDKEPEVAMHQSGHNSGVVHAGVYYSPGSLKAVLCTRGRHLLKEFCAEWRLPYIECGKLVVAKSPDEVGRLHELRQRAEANQVPGIRYMGPAELQEIEPNARGVAALHSPCTSIVDFRQVAHSLATDIRQRGGTLMLSAEAKACRRERGGVHVDTTGGEVASARVIICAGLQSDRVAVMAGDHGLPWVWWRPPRLGTDLAAHL